MIVINAHINQNPDFNDNATKMILQDPRAAGVSDFVNVGEVADLLQALEVNCYQDILLFTNLSPNYFFKRRGVDISKFQMKPMPDWRVEEYSFSASLYYHICQNYPIIQIHFITSALKRMVNDTDFLNLTGGIPTTVQRKREWMKSSMDYKVLLKKYILDKIYAANNSLLVPNHKLVQQNSLVNFYPN